MRNIVRWTAAAVMAMALAGCASTSQSGSPCESCTYAYRPTAKGSQGQTVCIVEGKVMNCGKNPPECPECARKAKEKQ